MFQTSIIFFLLLNTHTHTQTNKQTAECSCLFGRQPHSQKTHAVWTKPDWKTIFCHVLQCDRGALRSTYMCLPYIMGRALNWLKEWKQIL